MIEAFADGVTWMGGLAQLCLLIALVYLLIRQLRAVYKSLWEGRK